MKALMLAIAIAIFTQPAITASVLIPNNIQQQIKHAAKLKWPGNFEMQKYRIDNQIEAYYKVRFYKNRKVPPKVLKGIMSRARAKWPGDYEMQAYVIKNQVKAYLAIN